MSYSGLPARGSHAASLRAAAEVVYAAIARVAGILGDPPPGAYCEEAGPERVILEVYRARRGEVPREAAAWLAACGLASVALAARVDPFTAGLGLARRLDPPPGLHGLASALSRFYARASPEALVAAVSAVATEIGVGCARDPVLEAEASRLEAWLKGYGGVLGAILAAVFAASLFSPELAFAALAALVAVWVALVRVGRRFHEVQVELAWRECRLQPEAVLEALRGPSLPSPMELLGLPPPRL